MTNPNYLQIAIDNIYEYTLYECPICDYVFEDKAYCINHIKNTHTIAEIKEIWSE